MRALTIFYIFLALVIVAWLNVALGLNVEQECQKVKIKGEAEVLALYRKDGEWRFADPEQVKVRPKQLLKGEPGSQLVVLVIREESGKLHPFVYDWHVHGATRQFCTQ